MARWIAIAAAPIAAVSAAAGMEAMSRVVSAADPESLWKDLEGRLDPKAAILLKGSRGVRLERLVPTLESWAGVAQRTAGTS